MDRKIEAYGFDLDGTLADVTWRDPLNCKECGLDPPRLGVLAIARMLHNAGYGIFCVSGRQEKDRRQTEYWLMFACQLDYLQLYMRKTGDQRPDYVVKEEIYHQHLKEKYDILGMFDDRTQVVKMWRRLGLTCFQVDDRID